MFVRSSYSGWPYRGVFSILATALIFVGFAKANDEPVGSTADAPAVAHKHDSKDHHDTSDLSHANASANLPNVADPRFDMAIYTFVVFALLMAVLIKFAWGPISHGLEAREHDIEHKIEQARLGAEKAVQQLKEYEAKLAAAAEEARGIVAQSRLDAETARDKIIAEGKAVAQQERDRAIADISLAKNLALSEIAQKSVDTAIGLATSIVRREVKPADHEVLIQDALKQFPKSSLN